MKRRAGVILLVALILAASVLAGCSNSKLSQDRSNEKKSNTQQKQNSGTNKVVNIYTDRHYDTDEKLYETFKNETGITVNVIKGKSDELIERLEREGEDTEADILITADAGKIHRAKEKGLLKAVQNNQIFKNVPGNLRDKDNTWFGLTVRARVIVYAKDRVKPESIGSYDAITGSMFKGKVLVRSSSNIYNQSLLASFIEIYGEEKAKKWAEAIVSNMARSPEGNDRDQAKAIVAGIGDVAIMNTYYVGNMLNSSDPEEVKVAKSIGIVFPDKNGSGTHINVSGAGVTKNSKSEANAIKFIEFLTGIKAQKEFAEANYEYPVNPAVEASELLKSWGEFKSQNINLSKLGEYNKRAVEIFNEVGWK